jgi:hypothetical protein
MKRCHLIVSVATVWYLLTPPLVGDQGVNSKAPLTTWSQAGRYASEQDCEQAKSSFTRSMRSGGGLSPTPQMALGIQISQCIAADDFRLQPAPNASNTP